MFIRKNTVVVVLSWLIYLPFAQFTRTGRKVRCPVCSGSTLPSSSSISSYTSSNASTHDLFIPFFPSINITQPWRLTLNAILESLSGLLIRPFVFLQPHSFWFNYTLVYRTFLCLLRPYCSLDVHPSASTNITF